LYRKCFKWGLPNAWNYVLWLYVLMIIMLYVFMLIYAYFSCFKSGIHVIFDPLTYSQCLWSKMNFVAKFIFSGHKTVDWFTETVDWIIEPVDRFEKPARNQSTGLRSLQETSRLVTPLQQLFNIFFGLDYILNLFLMSKSS